MFYAHRSKVFISLYFAVILVFTKLHRDSPEFLYQDSYIYNRLAEEHVLISDFASIVFNDWKNPEKRRRSLRKWNYAISYGLFDNPTQMQAGIIVDVAGMMERLTGLPVVKAPDAEAENSRFHIRFGKEEDLWRRLVIYGKTEGAAKKLFEDTNCLARIINDRRKGIIRFAQNYIAHNSDESELTTCILEEFVHGFGLGHGASYRPAVLGNTGEPQRLSINDMILVRTLYDKRLTVGMSYEQAMPIVKVIIPELVKAVREHGEIALYQ